MPHWVVEKVADALNDHGKPVKGSRILILGLTYKKNIDDNRKSSAVEIMSLLQGKGQTLHIQTHTTLAPKSRLPFRSTNGSYNHILLLPSAGAPIMIASIMIC